MIDIYIDIHTHSALKARAGVISIKNILIQDVVDLIPERDLTSEQHLSPDREIFTGNNLISIGLHPWDSEAVKYDEGKFLRAVGQAGVVAFGKDGNGGEVTGGTSGKGLVVVIGECGLDRLRGADLATQTDLFIKQAVLAESVHKPVFIHCVRCWHELVSVKSVIKPDMPWIIHGFRGNAMLADKLISNGFYLSFGSSILSMNPVLAGILRDIPDERYFLETDNSGLTIEEIYEAAAMIKSLSLVELKTRLAINFENTFGIHGTSRMAAED